MYLKKLVLKMKYINLVNEEEVLALIENRRKYGKRNWKFSEDARQSMKTWCG